MFPSYFYKNILFIIVVFMCFMHEENNFNILSYHVDDTLSSSIFCSLKNNNERRCIFKNLCYNFYLNFMFLYTEKSIISGLNSKQDLKHIFATSVLNHSALPLKISVIYAKTFNNVFLYDTDMFMLHRFKPDNIMHVIHDDILPLYATYRDLCFGNISECASKYDIVFSDVNMEGSFIEWYRAFSKHEPLQLSKLNKSITYCFSRVTVGLSIDSLIFQYGFMKDRGATKLTVHQVQLIKQFRIFMLNHFEIINENFKFHAVFMGRKLNRKILNEDYVENMIKETFNNEYNTSLKLLNMDLSTNSSKEMIHAITKAKYLIGLHGSGMFLSMFLPENSIVVEIFPYGISKELVSPTYVMSLMPGIWIKYFSWENAHHLNSFPHPEYSSVFGGLTHLIRGQQINIFRNSSISPSRECCDDPLFLSRMYQDTIIDETFRDTITLALKPKTEYPMFDLNKLVMNEWFFPGVVQNFSCYRNNNEFNLSWNHPINVDFYTNVTYDIAIETYNKNMSVLTSNCYLFLSLDSQISHIKVWIKCSVFGNEGTDTFFIC